MTLGQRLQQRRRVCGIKNGHEPDGYAQAVCAQEMGISQAHYSRIENDVGHVSIWPLVRLAEFYGMALEDAFPEYRPDAGDKRDLITARAARHTVQRATL